AGLAQILVFVVPPDRRERDPVVQLTDLVQRTRRVGRHHQDPVRVLQCYATAAARYALLRIVGLVAHLLFWRHIERHGHRGCFLFVSRVWVVAAGWSRAGWWRREYALVVPQRRGRAVRRVHPAVDDLPCVL